MSYYVVVSTAQTRSIGIAVIAGALAAGAVAFAASRSGGPEETVPEGVEVVLIRSVDPAPPTRHPRFFDMFYVFTTVSPSRATAYPLANPPGIVIDLEGVPEPEEPAAALVGEDDRIRSVRRRVTDRGLRYIIGIDSQVARVEVEYEGEVVIVTPIR
ncbi:MAG TPA: hypothetical protein VM285_13015 [Polyangia bacterium]|nr:hypothetical protein [Polyangia bacterium]